MDIQRRAYSTFEVKAIDDDERVIEGIASTPLPDRLGDVMEPRGAEYKLPIPLLWQHSQDKPIGEVFDAKVSKDGISVKARFAKIDEPGRLKERIDEAWQSVKAKLVRGLSIGWAPLEAAFIQETGGLHVLRWTWAELSVVTIPANVDATILKIKELDLAASGPHLPGVSGTLPVVRAVKAAPAMSTVAEQITQFENTRASKVARMTELMTKNEGKTLDATQTEEYTGLESEVSAIDAHLPRLRTLEKTLAGSAQPVTGVKDPKTGAEVRGGTSVIALKSELPKGTAFTRYIMAKIVGKNSLSDAVAYSKRWEESTPEVGLALKAEMELGTKAVVNWGTTVEPAWAAPLAVVQPMANEFLELLRPATLIGKIPNLRRVPFNVSVPVQTGGGTYAWVGEGAPKPVGNLQLASVTLTIAKAAGIIVISEELARISSPSAEQTVRADMVAGMAQYLDQQFIDPTVAAVTNVSPGSITNAAPSGGSAGTSGANAETDFKAMVKAFIAANQSVADAVLIMSEANAFTLTFARNTNGELLFPNIGRTGGTIGGLSVITSQAAGNTIALVNPREILFADEGGVNIDVSREAAVEMNTTPTSPVTASSVLVSLWQNNLVGLRAERFINWKRGRLTAVYYINQAYV